jgi:hypothetical protein
MPKDPARRNRALLSIYHYGRRGSEALRNRPIPLSVWPLHRAVSEIIEPIEEASLAEVRLALADLCRTRGAGRNAKVDREIQRLAVTFSRLLGQQEWEQDVAARTFASIYYTPQKEMNPETAYLTAIQHLVAIHQKVQTDRGVHADRNFSRVELTDAPWKIKPFERERK